MRRCRTTGEVHIRALAAAEAAARLDDLAAVLIDAVAGGASVNFLAGLGWPEARAFWAGQLPGVADGGRLLFVAESREGTICGTVVPTFAPQLNPPHRAEVTKMLVARIEPVRVQLKRSFNASL